jgi:hypothetical protein
LEGVFLFKHTFLVAFLIYSSSSIYADESAAKKITLIHQDSLLEKFQNKIQFNIDRNLRFPYSQTEESGGMMRTLFFQQRKVFHNSNEMNSKMPWCSLRIQIKKNEDTIVPKRTRWSPVSMDSYSNNSYFTTYSYSFVNWNKGKKTQEGYGFSPFSFVCNVIQGSTFDYRLIRSIIGKRISLKSSLLNVR